MPKLVVMVKAAKCDATIEGQYRLGGSFGINGTPSIVLENGVQYQAINCLQQSLNTIKTNL
ncbi:hypothetical protein AB6C80_023430 [Vibrio cyclitrophicus]